MNKWDHLIEGMADTIERAKRAYESSGTWDALMAYSIALKRAGKPNPIGPEEMGKAFDESLADFFNKSPSSKLQGYALLGKYKEYDVWATRSRHVVSIKFTLGELMPVRSGLTPSGKDGNIYGILTYPRTSLNPTQQTISIYFEASYGDQFRADTVAASTQCGSIRDALLTIKEILVRMEKCGAQLPALKRQYDVENDWYGPPSGWGHYGGA